MIGMSKLYRGTVEASDRLRYGRQSGKLIAEAMAASLKRVDLSYVGVSLDGRRFTIDRRNARNDSEDFFGPVEAEGIPRVCFYHLVHAGRGGFLARENLSSTATRRSVDQIMDRTKAITVAADVWACDPACHLTDEEIGL